MKKETGVPGDPMDQLLKASMRDRVVPEADACVDAETLAAWTDGTLPPAQTTAVELHLSNCARCQAMLAVFAKTEPVFSKSRPFWTRSIAWFVPLAAAATLVIWIVVPKREVAPVPAPVRTSAEAASAPAPPTVLEPPASPVPPSKPGPAKHASALLIETPSAPIAGTTPATAAQPRAALQARPATAAPSPATGTAGTPPATPVPPVVPPAQGAAAPLSSTAPPVPRGDVTVTAGPPVADVPRGSQSSVLPPAPRGAAGAVTVTAAPPVTDPRRLEPTVVSNDRLANAPPPAAIGAGAAAQGTFRSSASNVAMTIEFSSPDSAARAMAAGGGGGRGGAGGGRGGGVPRPPARWRVRAGTIVERSIDQGITWEPIATDSAATITAGAAPTPVVCWLVGRGGLVLLMTDNQHFVRVKFPEEVDLAAVTAPNARQATVTTADGRVFVTTDAGATWRLQGFPTASF